MVDLECDLREVFGDSVINTNKNIWLMSAAGRKINGTETDNQTTTPAVATRLSVIHAAVTGAEGETAAVMAPTAAAHAPSPLLPHSLREQGCTTVINKQ